MSTEKTMTQLNEVASRIREMRDIMGVSATEMAKKTEVTQEEYEKYENGATDMPFAFVHKCALAFGMELTELLEGKNAHLSSYTVTRKGKGQETAKEDGITIQNLAPKFKNKIAEPHWVKYEYSEELQNKPIHLTKHSGQEFDLVINGSLKVQVGDHTEILNEGDSIYYNSSTPHGMIAVGGSDCTFCAVVLPGEDAKEDEALESVVSLRPKTALACDKFVKCTESEPGVLEKVEFMNTDTFNFGFDVVDEIAKKTPDKLAMLHVAKDMTERRFTFEDIKRESARCANYFASLGIKRGDKVMLVLKRHYQFWFAMVALHKLGAVAIPATHQLKDHDFVYRFEAAGVSAIVCTADDGTAEIAEAAAKKCPSVKTLVLVGGTRDGWHDFDGEYQRFSSNFERNADTPCGDDAALMFFSSGTTGNPKMVEHKHTYGLGHFVTAKYWHCCERDGLHFTISDTGWGKSLWGKLYGQWLCEGAVFVYDFDRFNANEILPMFAKYNITTFCAPPTMLRMFIKEDLSKFDLSSIHHMTTAGEALNPEVYKQFEKATGLKIMEGFGQTETTVLLGNMPWMEPKPGSMGLPVPQYDIDLVDYDGRSVEAGEQGQIVIRIKDKMPVGLFKGYYKDEQRTRDAIKDGLYYTGDIAWKDEDGYYWFVGRADDVIKSSGYRIGPFEVESALMTHPAVVECAITGVPDEMRGQVVKATIILAQSYKEKAGPELIKELQNHVKRITAPYKYPRIVEFVDDLPKTISGKVRRVEIRNNDLKKAGQ